MSLTTLQQDERDAMTGDRAAVLRVVTALREYRALTTRLANRRGVDSTTRVMIEIDTKAIEEGLPVP